MSENTPKKIPLSTRIQRRLREAVYSVGFQANWYLVILAAGTGIVTALGAMGFVQLLHTAKYLFFEMVSAVSDGSAGGTDGEMVIPFWLLILAPVVGAAICGIIVHFGAPEARGHGVPEVMISLYRGKGDIRPRVALWKSVASAFTIGSGGSAGAEGPIVQIGSAIGSNIGRLLRISPERKGTLLGCGAAAGIASVFNAPLAGVFFVLEILLRDYSLRTFTPIVIASVFSVATTQAVRGDEAIFPVTGELAQYQFNMSELPYYLVLGLVCGLVAVAFIRSLDFMETFYDRLKIHGILKPITGALALGAMTIAVYAVFGRLDDAGGLPAFYSNGYPSIKSFLTVEFYRSNSEMALLGMMLGLLVLKLFATCLTLGSGGSGGIFAPSLFLGAAVGGAFGLVVRYLSAGDMEPAIIAAFALVGMAAVVAGTTHAPLTAMLMLFEITRDYKVILPIMSAAVIATILAQLVLRDSIYTIKVRRRGVRVGLMSDLTILRRISVSEVPLAPAVTVRPEEPASRLLELAETSNSEDVVVVDGQGKYLGMVTGDDFRTTLLQIDALPLLVVEELMRRDLPTTVRDETLDVVMDKFSHHDASSLAVLAGDGTDCVVGVITRSRLMRQYHRALEQTM